MRNWINFDFEETQSKHPIKRRIGSLRLSDLLSVNLWKLYLRLTIFESNTIRLRTFRGEGMHLDIEIFAKSYEEYKDYLLGLTIYYQLIPKAIRWTNTGSFKRIRGRIQNALSEAEIIFSKSDSGEDITELLEKFTWPPKWGPMDGRVAACHYAYGMNKTLISSDYENLNKSEIKLLRNYISKLI